MGAIDARATWAGAGVSFALGSCLGLIVFTMLAEPSLGSDLPLHIRLVLLSRTEDLQLGYTVFYPLVDLLSGGGPAISVRRATVAVLSAAYGLRLAVTWILFAAIGLGVRTRAAATVVTSIATPLTLEPWAYYHIGKLSPVVWHNSTTILAVPFALLLFLNTWRLMTAAVPGWRVQVLQIALVGASAWTKPNYILVAVPALVLLSLASAASQPAGTRWPTLRSVGSRVALTVIAAACILLVQYWLTYGGSGFAVQGQPVTNVFAPFAVWEVWESRFGVRIVPSLALSVVPPALLTAFVWRDALYRLPLALAWTSVLVGLIEFTVFAEVLEDGTVLAHGNWVWGAQLSMAVLFVLTVGAFSRRFHTLGPVRWIPAAMLAFQVVMGISWLVLFMMIAP